MSHYPLHNLLSARSVTSVRERDYKKNHEVFDGAPCEWSRVRGATHTLYCGETEGPFGRIGAGTRPAKLLKSVLYVGTDEQDDLIVWEKWSVRTAYRVERETSAA